MTQSDLEDLAPEDGRGRAGATLDVTDCDREPIHIPGAIQPHGVLLVLDAAGDHVLQSAGDTERVLGAHDWLGSNPARLLGADLGARLLHRMAEGSPGLIGGWISPDGRRWDVSAQFGPEAVLIEIEPASDDLMTSAERLAQLERAGAAFERAPTLKALFETAAVEFRRLTGYDRIMVYRFLEDDSGVVVAEDIAAGARSFMNQHFPATDIPRQARGLYVRNRVRVIPQVDYEPAPLRPSRPAAPPVDLSDSGLRSVSPIHLTYLRNMEVGASASISIVRDGALWGLIACHAALPTPMTYEVRSAAVVLAGALSRQIKGRQESEAFRERLRLRGLEEELVARLDPDVPLSDEVAERLEPLRRMLEADGAAVVRGAKVSKVGVTPQTTDIRALEAYVRSRPRRGVFFTHALSRHWPEGARLQREASGVVATSVEGAEPFTLLWFRAERRETVRWAGDPHAGVKDAREGPLTPRASFDAWAETVEGQARRWTTAEVESAGRVGRSLTEVAANRRQAQLNLALSQALGDKDRLLGQQDFLMKEVNHRVQNSLSLVSSFLALQAREEQHEAVIGALKEARRRIGAVSMVHRRLHQADQIETIDLSRYIDELVAEVVSSSGPEWAEAISLDLAPASVEADRAVTLGLVVTELLINAQKYAYGGQAGPIAIRLVEDRGSLCLSVSDQGDGDGGGKAKGTGFGSRLLSSLATQLGGTIDRENSRPGLTVTVRFPLGVADQL
ncbi:histidine kinase dimerization/phosphoacceptor domain -containing protein [Brevundimonas sp.]|uniref:histidine kinase dimerization/phosphoacceptor domain -containing protein n=1 Tax=Brevundimonas sp. TaxID=1871086 RepID=UPI0035B2E090